MIQLIILSCQNTAVHSWWTCEFLFRVFLVVGVHYLVTHIVWCQLVNLALFWLNLRTWLGIYRVLVETGIHHFCICSINFSWFLLFLIFQTSILLFALGIQHLVLRRTLEFLLLFILFLLLCLFWLLHTGLQTYLHFHWTLFFLLFPLLTFLIYLTVLTWLYNPRIL